MQARMQQWTHPALKEGSSSLFLDFPQERGDSHSGSDERLAQGRFVPGRLL